MQEDILNAPVRISQESLTLQDKEKDDIDLSTPTDSLSLDSPVVIEETEEISNAVKTDIVEDHEKKEELEKDIPPNQDTLYTRYREKYPELFKNGKLVDFEAAQDIGIISKPQLVPTDDSESQGIMYGHASTKIDDKDFGYKYNTEAESVEVQKENARANQDFRRTEKVGEDFDAFDFDDENQELEAINKIIASMPEKNPNGSINLTKKFFELTGPTGFNFLMGIGEGVSYAGAIYTDAIEKMAKETQEIFPETYDNVIGVSPKELANKVAVGTGSFLEFSESVPMLGQFQSLFLRLPKANIKLAKKFAKKAEKNKKLAEKAWNRTLNVSKMKGATAQKLQETKENAKKVANQNKEVATKLIKEFEETTGKTISVTDKTGNKTLDYELARKVGNETAEDLTETKGTSFVDKVKEEITGQADISDSAILFGQGDTLFQPILKPEKFDGIVAVASDLMKSNPQAFNNNKKIIDNLFDLTVNKQLVAGDKLIDMLNKYGLSFEDYVLTVVGSGSTAGKVLNKISQIKRARPVNEMVAMQQAATIKKQDSIRNTIMRIENIRRGGLVSQIATAARNLTSAGIRAPLEGLGNVIDTAIYEMQHGSIVKGLGQLSPVQVRLPGVEGISPLKISNNWADSFRHMNYMFNNPLETKEVVDFILDRPELQGQYKLLFDNINEIMISTGRGRGGVLDKVLSEGEDAVMALNIPNRWQEFLVRRGAFLGELERLVKREYKIDFMDTLNQGKIRDLLNDASSVRPQGARSFIDIVADATQKALDVTYAKQPDIPIFRNISSFIVRNGLTVALPFPRFMFNSMELMGQYMGGASIPLTRKIMSIVKPSLRGQLTAKDRQRISRNLIGVATMLGAYQYRNSEEAPADYKKLNVSSDVEMDTTPQFPVKQFLYLGEAGRRLINGTFEDFFDGKEFLETFLGTNFRTGVGQSIFQDIAEIISATDLTTKETATKALIKPISEYLASWFVPFNQIIDTQRAMGERGLEYKDLRKDPTLDVMGTASKEFEKPFKQRGLFLSPEEEEKAPKREFVFSEDKKRVNPLYKVLLGLNLSTKDSEQGEYLQRLGYKDYLFGSKSGVPSVQRAENKIIRDLLPEVVRMAQNFELSVRDKYKSANKTTRDKYTEQAFVNANVKGFIDEQMRYIKGRIAKEGLGKYQSTEYARQLLQFRRIGKSLRRTALADFVARENREPDLLDYKDLARLNLIAKGDSKRGVKGYKQYFRGK